MSAGGAVKDFFAQWEVYRLCIDHNTLHHRQVGEALRAQFLKEPAGFRFLDLACGDAWTTAQALAGSGVGFYRGVDFSPEALALARKNTAGLGCGCDFFETDFRGYLKGNHGKFGAVYLGLSLHHLEAAEKREAMDGIRAVVSDGGVFFLYEPILQPGESRSACLARWKENMDRTWTPFPEAAKAAVWAHVESSDFPETPETWTALAEGAGFRSGVELFRDAAGFYSLLRFAG